MGPFIVWAVMRDSRCRVRPIISCRFVMDTVSDAARRPKSTSRSITYLAKGLRLGSLEITCSRDNLLLFWEFRDMAIRVCGSHRDQ